MRLPGVQTASVDLLQPGIHGRRKFRRRAGELPGQFVLPDLGESIGKHLADPLSVGHSSAAIRHQKHPYRTSAKDPLTDQHPVLIDGAAVSLVSPDAYRRIKPAPQHLNTNSMSASRT